MTMVTTEATVGQMVVERPSRARVFEKFGIDYCCGGKKPLTQACRERGVAIESVMEALASEASQPTEAPRNWAAASLTDLCDHIVQTHHAYLKTELPRLAYLTGRVASRHGDRLPYLVEVAETYAAMQTELEQHMVKEEQILFPLCRHMETLDTLAPMHCGSIDNPIAVMVREHEDAGDALAKMRSLTSDYTPPEDACNTFRAMYDALAQLEADMHQHVHKENNILFPKAAKLERLLANQTA